jgi:hypothetical protein
MVMVVAELRVEIRVLHLAQVVRVVEAEVVQEVRLVTPLEAGLKVPMRHIEVVMRA